MMKNQCGFTLLELLIAATIVGTLAVFATVAFKNSSADARIAAAKPKAEQLATAVQRYKIEYGSLPGNIGALAALGYIEDSGWDSDPYVSFAISGEGACMTGKTNSKLPARYQGYTYCVSPTGTTETFAVGS